MPASDDCSVFQYGMVQLVTRSRMSLLWMAVSSKMLSPHSWQQPIGIASATDYSSAGSNPATILKYIGVMVAQEVRDTKVE